MSIANSDSARRIIYDDEVADKDVQALLLQRCPAWYIAADSIVHAANALAVWLWRGSSFQDILGTSIFDILLQNWRYIFESRSSTFLIKHYLIALDIRKESATVPSSIDRFIDHIRRVSKKSPPVRNTLEGALHGAVPRYAPFGIDRELWLMRRIPPYTESIQANCVISRVSGRVGGFIESYSPEHGGIVWRRLDKFVLDNHWDLMASYVQYRDREEMDYFLSCVGDREDNQRVKEGHTPSQQGERAYPTTREEYDTTRRPIRSDEDFWVEYLGPLLNEEQAQKQLGIKKAETVFRRVERKKLLALPTRNGPAYPAFQFAPEGRVYPTIPHIINIFTERDAAATPYTIGAWLKGEHPELDHESPLEWLEQKKNPRRVIAAAQHDAWSLEQ